MTAIQRSREQGGYALIIACFMVTIFAACTLIAVEAMTSESGAAYDLGKRRQAEYAASSGQTWAIAKIRRGGVSTIVVNNAALGPTGTTYDTNVSSEANTVTILTRGRSVATFADGKEVTRSAVVVYQRSRMLTGKFIPSAALYFGNGAVEKPRGNYEGAATDSYISNTLPFKFSAWNHPYDFISSPIAVPPTTSARWRDQDPLSPRYLQPFNVFESQTSFGRSDVLDFVDDWTTSGVPFDPDTNANIEKMDGGYDAYPTYVSSPDVQTFSFDLWKNRVASGAVVLTAGDVNGGNYTSNSTTTASAKGIGTLANPKVVIVTGAFVNGNKAFQGAGILVVRDDYDPEFPPSDGNRQVTTKASMSFSKPFEWTGMVVIAGWAPSISTASLTTVTNTAKINGTLMGEDSVQSGGELSLEQATIQFYIGNALNGTAARAKLEVYYSKDAFDPVNGIYGLLPEVQKTVVSTETSVGVKPSWAAAVGW